MGAIDGLLGPRTRNAWAEFTTDNHQGIPDSVGPDSAQLLYECVSLVIPSDVPADLAGTTDAIRRECAAFKIGETNQVAYVLATVKWETGNTFSPVREAPTQTDQWRKQHFPYYPYYGRGYVQLTWNTNYAKYGTLLGIDLVGKPDLALDPPTALFILVHGFKTGAFTGRAITDFITADRNDFVGARRCINGTDHAGDIAKLAEAFTSDTTAVA